MTGTGRSRTVWAVLAAMVVVLVVVGVQVTGGSTSAPRAPTFTLALDPGTTLSGNAPDFTLSDQFGRPVSLSAYRGRAVVIAFNDSECTTVCPLTTSAMVAAQRMLGPAAGKMVLLGIDANPAATAVADVRSYSELHGMMHSWRFLTGSLPQLRRVWHDYHIDVAIEHGQIDHTPALFVIDPAGKLAKVYLTQMSYSSIDQQARLLADEVSQVLPEHPHVATTVSFAQIPTIGPTVSTTLPRAGGGTVAIGPGHGARLYAFFDTWDSEVTNLAGQLEALSRYQAAATAGHLPSLTAVDEASVESSQAALPHFLSSLRGPLAYPVAVDTSGRVADGYEVQDEPWFVLISPTGQILWYYDISTSGWLSEGALTKHVRAALTRASGPPSAAAAQAELAGSPAALAALHAQGGRVLGGNASLLTRLRALRGYPVVINAWASWCTPCRSEFGLFGAASARYGRSVAFLGADANDSPGDAAAFLGQHPVSYPSYQTTTSSLGSLAVVQGLPTTIFLNRQGRVVYVHTGQYESQGSLDEDVATYAATG